MRIVQGRTTERATAARRALITVWFLSSLIAIPVSMAQEVDFQKVILPILENRCWDCHGEDEQESGLRLDRRLSMLKGGDSGAAAVVPGDPAASYMLDLVKHKDKDLAMPPDEDPIPAEEIALLEKWIQQGAKWPGQMKAQEKSTSDHWAFKPVARPPIPDSKLTSPVDRFLEQKLKQKGLSFSPTATPPELIRRTSIVLTGLAPTFEETEQFNQEYGADPDRAFTRLVDRLLESPHFGERWAQHWLDVIRWAETNGSESNLYRKNAWIYRDYVIRSFNEDKPYDQFIREQIAGDSLGSGEATGFLVAGPHVPPATVGREPTAIRQARADRMDEIMQTLGAGVMGITIGCARCHNHKFDPISIRDYYAMTAVFQDIEFGSRFPELSDDHPRRIRGLEIRQKIERLRKTMKQWGGWEENWGAFRELHFKPISTKAIRIRFKQPNLGLDELEVFGPESPRTNLVDYREPVKLTGFPRFGGNNPIDRINDGEYGTMAWRPQVPKDSKQLPWVQFDFETPRRINRIRLSNNREYFYDTDYLEKKPFLPRYQFDMDVMGADGKWKPWVGTWYVTRKLAEEHPERKKILADIQRLIEQLAEEGPQPSFVGRLIRPAVTHVLMRGSPENPRAEVFPAGPEILNGELKLDSRTPGPKRRLEFSRWITQPENPLTARVMVNRIWHHVFGTGIVSTTSDFGSAGAAPSHPELLDWLAAEFMAPQWSSDTINGPMEKETENNASDQQENELANSSRPRPWSVKHILRTIVLSQAFRQSSAPNPQSLQIDSGSTLLWRFPPKRVEAEVIRDSILQASGVLNKTIGGRSYRIHNVKKTYAQWKVVDNHGPSTWRRMIYQERMRRVDDRLFTAFDFPDCGQVRAKRPVSTTPLQALNLLNSEFVLEQSKLVADRAMKESDQKPEAAVVRCFELLLGRNPSPAERQASIVVGRKNGLAFVCRALINSNEFVFLP